MFCKPISDCKPAVDVNLGRRVVKICEVRLLSRACLNLDLTNVGHAKPLILHANRDARTKWPFSELAKLLERIARIARPIGAGQMVATKRGTSIAHSNSSMTRSGD